MAKQKNENIIVRALKDFWSGYFNPKGKLDIKTFSVEIVFFFLVNVIVGMGLGLISPTLVPVAKIIGLILFIPMIMAGMRRIQDSGKSFGYALTWTVIYVAVCVYVTLTQFYLATEIMDVVMLFIVFMPAPNSKPKKKSNK